MDRQGLLCTLALAASLSANGARAQTALCTDDTDVERVDGNLNVVGFCELDDVEIRGNVRVLAGGSLVARDVSIGGNLTASGALDVDVSSSVIDGNVELEELIGVSSALSRTDVYGNVVVERNLARVELVLSYVRGNVDVVLNTGGVELTANAIDGKLECERNEPAPVLEQNRVGKGAEGQCAPLSPAPAPRPPEPSPPEPSPPRPPAPAPPVSPPAPPLPSPAPPSAPEPTTSSFVPQPEGGGGGAAGVLEIVLLPLLVLGRFRCRLARQGRGAAGSCGAEAG